METINLKKKKKISMSINKKERKKTTCHAIQVIAFLIDLQN